MVFYKEDPNRDWLYVTTWLQQASIYLPLGVELGGHTATRRLFLGAGENREDLLPWSTTLKPELLADLPTEMDAEHDGLPQTIESLRSGLLKKIKVDPSLGRLIVQEKDGAISAASANLFLATALTQRLKVYAVPAFMTNQKADLLGRLPLGAFSRVVTAIKMQDSWYYLDAGEPAWTLVNYDQYIKGKNLVLIDGTSVKASSY